MKDDNSLLWGKYDLEKLFEMCNLIGKHLGFEPEIEWRIGNGDVVCYSPKSSGNYHTTLSQKIECERWYNKQLERPNGWAIKEGFKPESKEWYPFFFQDWSALISAVIKLQDKNIQIKISTNIEDLFESVYSACSNEKL